MAAHETSYSSLSRGIANYLVWADAHLYYFMNLKNDYLAFKDGLRMDGSDICAQRLLLMWNAIVILLTHEGSSGSCTYCAFLGMFIFTKEWGDVDLLIFT